MRSNLKKKYCEYLLILNLIGGIIFLSLYTNNFGQLDSSTERLLTRSISSSTIKQSSRITKVVETTTTTDSTQPKDTITLGNSADKRLVKVILWTYYFSEKALITIPKEKYWANCPVQCQFTLDRDQLQDADAVVFHSRDISSSDFPTYHSNNQLWVYMNQESPANTRSDLRALPDVFNWTMTYRTDSDVYHPYGEVIPISESLTNIEQFLNRGALKTNSTSAQNPVFETDLNPSNDDDDLKDIQAFVENKSKLVAWVVSNCKTQSQREKMVSQLKQFIPVDIFGSCGKHKCKRNGESGCFQKIEKTYKFYLSFENSLCTDYVTEKLFNILHLLIVPIVYGGADYTKIAPPGSYINARDFNSTEDLAKYLMYLDKDPKEYLKYFKWKKYYKVIPGEGWCSLCVKLNVRNKFKSDKIVTKWYSNHWRWWNFKPEPGIVNYQIGYSDRTIKKENNIQDVVNDYSNYYGHQEPFYITSRDDTEDTKKLTRMCSKPLNYPVQSQISKISKAFHRIFDSMF